MLHHSWFLGNNRVYMMPIVNVILYHSVSSNKVYYYYHLLVIAVKCGFNKTTNIFITQCKITKLHDRFFIMSL